MGFSMFKVSLLIALLGLFSAVVQSVLGIIMKMMGAKYTIMIGLVFEIMQLMWFGFGSETWYVNNNNNNKFNIIILLFCN